MRSDATDHSVGGLDLRYLYSGFKVPRHDALPTCALRPRDFEVLLLLGETSDRPLPWTRTNNQLLIGLGAVEIAISWSRRFAKAMSVECIVGETWVGAKPPKLSPHFPPNTGPADW